jgi:hypothetical protein
MPANDLNRIHVRTVGQEFNHSSCALEKADDLKSIDVEIVTRWRVDGIGKNSICIRSTNPTSNKVASQIREVTRLCTSCRCQPNGVTSVPDAGGGGLPPDCDNGIQKHRRIAHVGRIDRLENLVTVFIARPMPSFA